MRLARALKLEGLKFNWQRREYSIASRDAKKEQSMTDLKTMLIAEIDKNGDRPAIIICNVNAEVLCKKFSNDFGGDGWTHFVAHTDKFIYYTEDYDGAVGVKSVSRDPDKNKMNVIHYNELMSGTMQESN